MLLFKTRLTIKKRATTWKTSSELKRAVFGPIAFIGLGIIVIYSIGKNNIIKNTNNILQL